MTKSHPAQILIVDDHPVLVAGLTALIDKTDDLRVCGSADSVESLAAALETVTPGLFVLDIHLRTSDGFEVLKELRQHFFQTPVLVFSMHDEAFYAERALQAGAKGYLMKTEASSEVLHAIRKLLRGELYVSDRLQSLLLARLDTTSSEPVANPIKKLTNRELQVIQLIGKGKNNREIASVMDIRLKTVEAHRFRIREKLNLKHSTELIQFAVHWVQREGVDRESVTA